MDLRIHSVDLAVIVAYLLAVVALGVYLGRGKATLTSYFLGNRDLPWWAILGSIVATETSTVTFLSVPGITYASAGDFRFLQLTFGFIFGRILISIFLLPWYFKGNFLTAYELLEERFGTVTKRLASVIFLIARNGSDALRLFLTALVLQEVLGGQSDWLLPVCIGVIGWLTILYTLFGGMKAVVWNDCLQLVIYMLGAVIILAVIVQRLPDGLSQIVEYAGQGEGYVGVFDFSFSWNQPYTFWAGLVGGMFLTMGTHGADQMIVQRLLAARKKSEAKLALIASGVVICLQFAFFLFLGTALACYTAETGGTPVEKGDRALASFVVNEMPQGIGLVGIILAGVTAAAMSTLSSSLNSSATVLVNDFLMRDREQSDRWLFVGKWLTLVFGIVQIAIAIATINVTSSVVNEVLAIAGLTVGILLGLIVLARLNSSQAGAIVGIIVGTMVLLIVKFATTVAWPWYSVIGTVTVVASGLLVGRFSQNDNG